MKHVGAREINISLTLAGNYPTIDCKGVDRLAHTVHFSLSLQLTVLCTVGKHVDREEDRTGTHG